MKSKTNLIFGIHPVQEAVRAGKPMDKILLKQGMRNELIPGIIQLLRQQNIPFQFVPVEKLNRLTGGNHQGIIAIASELEYTDLERLIPGFFEQGRLPLVAVLDGITDVRNMGAIARTAECAGVDALIIPAKGGAQVNADAIKTSAGALHTIPVCRVADLTISCKFLKDSGFQLIAASEKGSDPLYSADFTHPTALIMGAEDTGVNKNLLRIADKIIKIPVYGAIQSLNVSVAASVLFYEAVRQRNFNKS